MEISCFVLCSPLHSIPSILKDQNFKKDFNHVSVFNLFLTIPRVYPKNRLIHVKVTFLFFPRIISGEGDDYLTISLRDGGVAVGMTLAKGRLDLHIKPVRVRFDDNQWHRIIVHRKVQEVRKFIRLIFVNLAAKFKRWKKKKERKISSSWSFIVIYWHLPFTLLRFINFKFEYLYIWNRMI